MIHLEHQAITNAERTPRADPVVRCPDCRKTLGVLAGDRLTVRIRGREYLVALPARITCDCGATLRLT